MDKEASGSDKVLNEEFKVWRVGITFRVVMQLLVLVIVPMLLTSWMIETGELLPGKNIYFLIPILALVLVIPLARLISYFFINKDLAIVNKFCRQLRDGNYQIHFPLEAEKENEDQFIILLRNLTWMSLRLNQEHKEAQIRYNDVKDQYQEIEEDVRTDKLTGLFNRSHFDDILNRKAYYATVDDAPISLIFIDFDKFDEVNVTMGVEAGELILVHLAECLRKVMRLDSDTAFRFDGNKFGIILTRTDGRQAINVAERIMVLYREKQFGDVTLSMGIATSFFNSDSYKTEVVLLEQDADKQIYSAKVRGGNCIRRKVRVNLKSKIA